MNLKTQIAQTHQLTKALQLAAEASAGRQGVLLVAHGAMKAAVYIESGRIVGAEIKNGAESGVQALQKIVALPEAAFAYEDGAPPPGTKRIYFAIQELLKYGLALPEKNEPVDRAVVGDEVDNESLKTLSAPIKFDPNRPFPDSDSEK